MKKLTLLLIAVLGLTAAVGADQTLKRPNILYIIVDDQSPFDFKFYNQRSQLDAPVIEKLAAEGMVIDGAYQMGVGGWRVHGVAAHDHERTHSMAHSGSAFPQAAGQSECTQPEISSTGFGPEHAGSCF